ncbi:MAG: type II toxin-antitoxin system RelE/ParE family toxin [Defluviitaleaceae bacterium]|nr:type II toxin-antitoxin system RelE/ParE family toxin [Defluviitaleaceae bacterium]
MYRVDISNRADYELDKILAYISEDLVAPQAAVSFVDEVYACYDRLEENPYIYEACRDQRLSREGYRRAVIKNYVMLYKIYDHELVIVHHFFYGGQDYAKLV